MICTLKKLTCLFIEQSFFFTNSPIKFPYYYAKKYGCDISNIVNFIQTVVASRNIKILIDSHFLLRSEFSTCHTPLVFAKVAMIKGETLLHLCAEFIDNRSSVVNIFIYNVLGINY